MSDNRSEGPPPIIGFLLNDEYVSASVLYVVAAIPAYIWLEGPVGNAGTVDGSTVIVALVTGSMLLVPGIAIGLRRKYGVGVPDNLEKVENGAFQNSFNTLSQEEE